MAIDESTKFTMGKMSCEVNWNEDVTPCKKFKFKLGEETEVIDRDDLFSILFLFGDIDDKESLIPVRTSEVIMVRRMLKVKAKKDIREGETIQTWYEYPVAKDVYDKISLTDKTAQQVSKSAKIIH